MPRISRSRPNSWYRSWMVVDGENAEERVAKRWEVAKELRDAVKTPHYDSQTLEEIVQVLDHEILCSRPTVNELEDDIRTYRSGEDLRPRDLSVLCTPWIDHFLTTLSDCLVQSISKSSHYERELQSRSLISALALLRAQRVESHQTDDYDLLRSRFEERFRDLQWQRKLSGPFTREKFRHFQCSYLLCAGAEYAKMFERARPHAVSVLSRAVDVALLGVSITLASQAVHGVGIGRLPLVLEDLDRALRPLWLSPNEQYQDLFEVQDLTRILTAFHFYGRVVSQDPASPSPILDCSRDFAKIILGHILQLLDQRPDFEKTDRPPPAIWDQILAFFKRGPPDFSRYFYLYGLLDCATQVARTVPLASVGRNFTSRMRLIIQSSKEPSYRWKAIEFLLCDPKTRNEEAQKIWNSCRQSQPTINLEIEAIRECLNEEEGVTPPKRDQSMTFSESELLSSDSTLSVPPLPKLIPGGWIEPPFSTQNLSPKETSFDIAIKPRSLFKFSPDCHSVALSPDCKSATFFTESLVRIFSLRDPKPNLILEKTPTRPKSSYKAAVASNRFLAVVTDEHLKVYIYGPSNPDGIEIGTETFSSDSSEWPWGPNCVAIHETEERTWIAVGGCGNKKGQEYGSIRMYRVDATAGSFTLTAQSANFARQDDFTPEGPLSNDYLKMIAFSPDGRRLVAVTAYNRALVWFLSNNRRPRHAPFEILKKYTMETEAHGMLSATIFHSPSSRPYVLCTTSPSDERWKHGGEWSFISAVADSPAYVSPILQFDFCALGKREKGIVTGAASPDGKVVALLNQKGKIKLFTLKGKTGGGLYSALEEPLILKEKLAERKSASSGCLRFQSQDGNLFLFAVDPEGKVIRTDISNIQPQPRHLSPAPAEPLRGLRLLYDGTTNWEGEAGEGDVDIVAVHGLNGDPLLSFADATTGCCWLRDLLPKDFPHYRVYSYGYDANTFTGLSTMTMYDLSKRFCEDLDLLSGEDRDRVPRPLIFVGHSLGGLLIKHLLVMTKMYEDRFGTILEKTAGILFFGTPHRATSNASWTRIAVNLLRAASAGNKMPNRNLVREMESASEQTKQIHNDFLGLLLRKPAIVIYTFYEELGSPLIGVVVDRSSTTLSVPNEVVISLHTVHHALCKFPNELSPNYRKVREALKNLSRDASQKRSSGDELSVAIPKSVNQLSVWIPHIVSQTGTTTLGLLDMAGSTEDPQDFTHADIDIVAIHGFGGSPTRSWMNNAANTLWLRDFLQADFPTAHITSYGYKAESALRDISSVLSLLASDLLDNVIGARSGSTQEKLRPIVFIGYSFGGLILKKALLLLRGAVNSSPRGALLSALAHVIFLGVPHEGEELDIISRWTGILQCATGIKHFDNFSIGQTMEQIYQVTKEFRGFENIYAASIAESEPTRTLRLTDKTILVSGRSVRLGWGSRETIFVARNRNHLELPTFVDPEDPTYVYIRDIVSKLFRRLGLGGEAEESEACLLALQRAHLGQRRTFEAIPFSEPGCCDWIFDLTQMRGWLHDMRGKLLIEGPPGSGKTVLAKHLIPELPKALGQGDMAVLYHFFTFRDSDFEAEGDEMLASLLYQLCHIHPSLIRCAIEDFRLMRGDFATSPSVLWKIFSSAVEKYSGQHLIIVLDGLDECRPISSLLQLLDWLQGFDSLGLILTTRSIPELRYLRNEQDTAYIDWRSSCPDTNLRLFIRQKLDGMQNTIPPNEREKLGDQIFHRAGGIILWANFVVNLLQEKAPSGKKLSDNFVSSIPAGLSDLYDTLFERFRQTSSSHDWAVLLEVLSILLVILKPMTVELVVEALNVSTAHIHQNQAWGEALMSEGYTVSYVQRQIIERLSLFNLNSSGDLRFVHVSIKDYLLLSDCKLWSNRSMSPITEGHLKMADRCVSRIRLAISSENTPEVSTSSQGTFIEYAATNWMHHFFESQDLVDDSLNTSVYDLFRVSDDSSPISRWLLLYEKATTEMLPRHKIFGPLFGAAYFGLRPIVQMALEIGDDIEAPDEEGRTALHWASERGHVKIVDMLLTHGADPENRTHAGWSSLHFAAQQGHAETIKVLLRNGTNMNLEAADGRSPLQVAMEAGRVGVVGDLLNAGADATQGSYTGLSVVQVAQATDEMLKTLMESSTAPNTLLRRSIFDNNSSMLSLLFQWRSDVIMQEYPWVSELLDENIPEEEVLDLLLKSENLDWISSEELTIRNMENWKQIVQFEHQRRCAHQLKFFSVNTGGKLVRSKSQNNAPKKLAGSTQEDELSTSKSGEIHSRDSSETDSTQSASTPLDPEIRIDGLEKREQELISFVGVGGVFPPEQCRKSQKLNPGFAKMRRHVSQILYGDQPTGFFMSIDVAMDVPALQYNHKVRAEADYDGASVYSTWTRVSQESGSSYDSETHDDNYEIWDQGSARKVLKALENVLSGIKYLHTEGECCDRYTVLIKSPRRDRVIEVKTITASALRELCNSLEEFCDASDSKPSGWTKHLAARCLAVFDNIGYGEMASEFLRQSLGSGKTASPSRCLHICALIAQIASVSLVTYSRGHSREFYTSYLTRPIEFFILGGLEDHGPSFCAERVDLACMGNMLGRKVWMFHQEKKAMGTFKETFLLSTNIENLLDTWGGWISIQSGHESSEICVHTGGGSITSAQHESEKGLVVENEVYCHWISELGHPPSERYPISKHAQLLIGATSVNGACSLTVAACQKSIANNLVPLGTRPPSWKTTGRMAGFSGGQWVNFNTNRSQTKDDGRNLKRLLIDGYQASQDLRKLNSPWGLELSLCTGIARRVLLRHLMHGEVLQYLELGLPGEWNLIATIVATVSQKSDADFEQLLRDLTREQSEVLKKATELLITAMESTGVGSDGHTLTLWWPERNAPAPRGIKIFKTQYSGKNPWIAMIKDSEHCAVFGLATTRCLQHDEVKICRHLDLLLHPLSPVENIILDTTLTPAESELASLPYSKDSRYLLWKREDILRVTRARQDTQGITADVVQLAYSPGRILPPIAVTRLKLAGKLEHVKEKSGWSDPGQGVLIL